MVPYRLTREKKRTDVSVNELRSEIVPYGCSWVRYGFLEGNGPV